MFDLELYHIRSPFIILHFCVLYSNDYFLEFHHCLFLLDPEDSPLQVSTLLIEEHP